MKRKRPILLSLIIHWFAQGLIHRSPLEKLVRLLTEIIIIFILILIINMECGLLLSLFFAFFVAHSAFFIIDSHLWAVLRIHKWPKAKYISYIRMIANDVNKSKHIRGAAIFGSFSKRNFNEFSDLDLALVPKEGAKNFIMTYFLGVRLKSKALFTGFPLDLSIITNLEYKLKSTDKMPIILYEHSNYVSDMFPHAILLTEFITQVYNS